MLLDALTLTGCMQRLKECAFATGTTTKGGTKGGGRSKASQTLAAAAEGDDDMDDADDAPAAASRAAASSSSSAASAADVDVAMCLCVETLQNLAVACQQTSLKSNKEALQAAVDGCVELLGCSKAIKPPAGAKTLGLCTTGTRGRIP